MKTGQDKEFINNMSKDPGHWKGPFYVNRKDHRLMVPKLNPSLGWTFNFGSRYTYIAALAIIVAIIVCVVLS